ncbi:MAG TPA: hypothetical protein VN948_13590 [Terriglobales bacterium]|nr:hypothetical protein [Terriglobales bacterium]
MRSLCFALALTLISAASYAAPAGDQASQSFSPGSTRTVSGTRIGHYEDGPVPVDLSVRPVAANVPDGSGGYTVISGSGTSAGAFTIPNVPVGFYLLRLGSFYVWTRNSVVDADFHWDFRSTGVMADSNSTMTFDLTHLRAWRSTDFFEVVCPNNAAFDLFPGTVGETTFTGTFPYIGNLSDASLGDQYYMFQLMTQKVKGYSFTALGRYIAPPKFTQQQGSDTAIDGRLRTIAQTGKFEANVNGADLAAQTMAANPKAVMTDTTILLDVYPGTMAKGFGTSTPDLVAYNFGTGEPFITTNGDLGQILYGNPFPPAKWPLFASYSYAAATTYVAPGATNGAPITSLVLDYNPTLPTSQSPMTPLVGVVQNPSINGRNFFQDRIGVGSIPLLKWSAPSVGTATFYEVQVYELTNDGAGNTVINLIFRLRTQNTSLRIPPGRLTTGLGYVFVIRPYYVPGLNFVKTPFMSGPTSALADVLSGMMQP